jgi:hypothetical protein
VRTYAGWRYEAANCTVVEPHVTIECVTLEGLGVDLGWSLTVGGQTGPRSVNRTKYTTPRLDNVTIDGNSSTTAGIPTRGGPTVTFAGVNFGPIDVDGSGGGGANDTRDARVGVVNEVYAIAANPALASASALAGVAGVRAVGCAVTVANRVIVCAVGPGVGYDLRFRVVVGGQSSAPYERLNVSYEVGEGSLESPPPRESGAPSR